MSEAKQAETQDVDAPRLTLWQDLPDPFAKLPALAARLGVEPHRVGDAPSFVVITKEGVSYDVFALVNAFLDRLDASVRP